MVYLFEQLPNEVEDPPTLEQLQEYRDLMVDILCRLGKDIRYARQGERLRTRFGTEYLLPGALTEWSEPDQEMKINIMRHRVYSASYRTDNDADAGRLLVLEADSVRDGRVFDVRRNMFCFSWQNKSEVNVAKVLPIQIISDSKTDGEVIQAPAGARQLLSLDHERTVDTAHPDVTPGHHRYINPMRDTESPWRFATKAHLDILTRNTDMYGRDLSEHLDLQSE